jgi:hypothetical protein
MITLFFNGTLIAFAFNVKGPIHPKGSHTQLTVQFNCVKKLRKTELNVLWHSAGFPLGLSVFFVSSVCLLVRVTMEDKNKAVVRCLLATSAIMLSEKKKRMRKM